MLNQRLDNTSANIQAIEKAENPSKPSA